MHAFDQTPDLWYVPVLAHLACAPQAGTDHYGQRPPNDTALILDAGRIGLHLPKIPGLLGQMLLSRLPLDASAGHPVCNRALI